MSSAEVAPKPPQPAAAAPTAPASVDKKETKLNADAKSFIPGGAHSPPMASAPPPAAASSSAGASKPPTPPQYKAHPSPPHAAGAPLPPGLPVGQKVPMMIPGPNGPIFMPFMPPPPGMPPAMPPAGFMPPPNMMPPVPGMMPPPGMPMPPGMMMMPGGPFPPPGMAFPMPPRMPMPMPPQPLPAKGTVPHTQHMPAGPMPKKKMTPPAPVQAPGAPAPVVNVGNASLAALRSSNPPKFSCVLLSGLPATGKTTLGRELVNSLKADELGWAFFSGADFLQDVAHKRTIWETTQEVYEALSKRLDTLLEEQKESRSIKGIVIDKNCKGIEDVYYLNALLRAKNIPFVGIIGMESANDDVLIQRMGGEEDLKEKIKFHRVIHARIASLAKSFGMYHEVDASKSKEEVIQSLRTKVLGCCAQPPAKSIRTHFYDESRCNIMVDAYQDYCDVMNHLFRCVPARGNHYPGTSDFVPFSTKEMEDRKRVEALKTRYEVRRKVDGQRFLLVFFREKMYLVPPHMRAVLEMSSKAWLGDKLTNVGSFVLEGTLTRLTRDRQKEKFLVFDTLFWSDASNVEVNTLLHMNWRERQDCLVAHLCTERKGFYPPDTDCIIVHQVTSPMNASIDLLDSEEYPSDGLIFQPTSTLRRSDHILVWQQPSCITVDFRVGDLVKEEEETAAAAARRASYSNVNDPHHDHPVRTFRLEVYDKTEKKYVQFEDALMEVRHPDVVTGSIVTCSMKDEVKRTWILNRIRYDVMRPAFLHEVEELLETCLVPRARLVSWLMTQDIVSSELQKEKPKHHQPHPHPQPPQHQHQHQQQQQQQQQQQLFQQPPIVQQHTPPLAPQFQPHPQQQFQAMPPPQQMQQPPFHPPQQMAPKQQFQVPPPPMQQQPHQQHQHQQQPHHLQPPPQQQQQHQTPSQSASAPHSTTSYPSASALLAAHKSENKPHPPQANQIELLASIVPSMQVVRCDEGFPGAVPAPSDRPCAQCKSKKAAKDLRMDEKDKQFYCLSCWGKLGFGICHHCHLFKAVQKEGTTGRLKTRRCCAECAVKEGIELPNKSETSHTKNNSNSDNAMGSKGKRDDDAEKKKRNGNAKKKSPTGDTPEPPKEEKEAEKDKENGQQAAPAAEAGTPKKKKAKKSEAAAAEAGKAAAESPAPTEAAPAAAAPAAAAAPTAPAPAAAAPAAAEAPKENKPAAADAAAPPADAASAERDAAKSEETKKAGGGMCAHQ